MVKIPIFIHFFQSNNIGFFFIRSFFSFPTNSDHLTCHTLFFNIVEIKRLSLALFLSVFSVVQYWFRFCSVVSWCSLEHKRDPNHKITAILLMRKVQGSVALQSLFGVVLTPNTGHIYLVYHLKKKTDAYKAVLKTARYFLPVLFNIGYSEPLVTLVL